MLTFVTVTCTPRSGIRLLFYMHVGVVLNESFIFSYFSEIWQRTWCVHNLKEISIKKKSQPNRGEGVLSSNASVYNMVLLMKSTDKSKSSSNVHWWSFWKTHALFICRKNVIICHIFLIIQKRKLWILR